MNRKMTEQDKNFMREAIALSLKGMTNGEGGPFGCVIVKDGIVVGRGNKRPDSSCGSCGNPRCVQKSQQFSA
jgi:tRNA(Arg) A34 adenosine deaminase TadA